MVDVDEVGRALRELKGKVTELELYYTALNLLPIAAGIKAGGFLGRTGDTFIEATGGHGFDIEWACVSATKGRSAAYMSLRALLNKLPDGSEFSWLARAVGMDGEAGKRALSTIATGLFLGYPACCIRAFAQREAETGKGSPPDYPTAFRHHLWAACSDACPATAEYDRAAAKVMEQQGFGDFGRRWWDMVLVSREEARLHPLAKEEFERIARMDEERMRNAYARLPAWGMGYGTPEYLAEAERVRAFFDPSAAHHRH